MIITFLFSHSRTRLSHSCINTALFHLRLWLHQHFFSSGTGQTSNPSSYCVLLKQLWRGYTEPSQRRKKPTQIPPTNHFSPFLLYYSSSRAVAWFGLKYSYAKSSFKTVKTRNKWLGHRGCLCSTAAKSESSLRPQWFFIQPYSHL